MTMQRSAGIGRTHLFLGAAALVALAGHAAAIDGQVLPSGAESAIQWKSAPATPLTPESTTLALGGKAGEHIVVSLTAPITDTGRAELQKLGLTLLAPLGPRAFFASLDVAAAAPGPLLRSGWLAGAAPVRPEWKLHPALLANETPPWTVVRKGPDPEVAVYITFHDDVPVAGAAAPLLARRGGLVITSLVSVNATVAHMPRSALALLAGDDEVQWIEPAMPFMTEINAENRALTGVNIVNAAPYSLNGTGVKVLVFDGGSVRATHVDLAGRVTLLDGSAVSNHSTHVAGTVGGSGAGNANNRGMAPGVTILSAALATPLPSGFLYTNPGDLESDYANAFNQGAHLATNSIGTNTAPNGFDCKWEGDYNTTDAVIDSIVRGNSAATGNTPFRVMWAGGNERGSGRCGANYRTIGPPAGAKNHLCIGSVDSNTDNSSSFTGWGPTDDGRMKPDFSAPGCQTNGDNGVTSCGSASDTAYATMCGTSMATPTVAGCVALLLQDFRAQFPATPDPRNSTLKVLFAQSAVDRGNPGPDYQYGYGSVRVQAAIDLMRTGNFSQGQVSQGNDASFDVTVPAGAPELELTLAWDDPAATPNVIPVVVNDLDLEVYSPTGLRAFPWTLDPNNPAANAAQTQRNSRDNLEQVRVASPEAGTWHVRVKGVAVPTGPQPFSLVASHTLASGASFQTLAVENVSVPALASPTAPTAITASVRLENDTLIPGSVTLFYRDGAGPFTPAPMSPSGPNWTASLPAFPCAGSPQYYVAAAGQSSGVVTFPAGGPAAPLSIPVGTQTVYFTDDMETNTGWTVGPNTATTGVWNRVNPEGTASQPEDDATPAPGVTCWVTNGTAGTSQSSNDVDGGNTLLTTPTFDMTGAPSAATISYMRWFDTNTITTYSDAWLVEISNNNGASWVTFESLPVGAPVELGWRKVSRTLGSVGLAGTNQMKLRFKAEDTGTAGIVEAAIDDFVASSVSCTNPPACYANCDQSTATPVLNVADFSCFLQRYANNEAYANCDASTSIPTLNVADFSCFLQAYAAGCP